MPLPKRNQNILHRLLAQVVVDAVDVAFVEDFVQLIAQFTRARKVVTERLFDHQPPPPVALSHARRADPARDRRILARLRRKVEQHVAAGAPLPLHLRQFGRQRLVHRRVLHVARDVEQPARERRPHILVQLRVLAELLHRFAHLLAELFVRHRRARRADHRESRRQPPVVRQPVEGRHQLAFGQVPVGSEDHRRAFRGLPLEAQRIVERIIVGHSTHHITRGAQAPSSCVTAVTAACPARDTSPAAPRSH